jgi:two-component system osmolarity sensor histidine kinase EnvZ
LRLWPQRLVGQVTLVLMLAVALEFIGSSSCSRTAASIPMITRSGARPLVTAETLLPRRLESPAGPPLILVALPSLVDRERSTEHD